MLHNDAERPAITRRTLGLMVLSAAVGAGLVLAVLWLLPGNHGGRGVSTDREIVARLEALERQDQIGGISSQVDTAPTRRHADDNAAYSGAGQGETLLTPAQVAAQAKAMEAEFLRQRPDPASAQRELEMLGAMTAPMLTRTGVVPGDPEVECRREACRITASFRSEFDAIDWATLYVTTLGAKYASHVRQAVVTKPDGTVQAILYMTK
jgi:hypothetical protein